MLHAPLDFLQGKTPGNRIFLRDGLLAALVAGLRVVGTSGKHRGAGGQCQPVADVVFDHSGRTPVRKDEKLSVSPDGKGTTR
jgi:hypothetical protein